MRSWAKGVLASTLVSLSVLNARCVAETVVSPLQYTDRDAPASSQEWGLSSRGMTIYSSNLFNDGLDGPIEITSFNLRPDARHRVGDIFGFDNLKLVFMVTPAAPNELVQRFGTNLDNAISEPVVVFDGAWSREVANPQPASPQARPFDFDVPLSTPFVFNPADGNLLVDWYFGRPLPNQASFDRPNTPSVDQLTIWNLGDAPQFGNGFQFSVVTQFEFAQVIRGDWDADGELLATDLQSLIGAIMEGNHDPTFDLSGDQLVDHQDLHVWVRDLKHTWFGDANLDGVFSTLDLVEVLQTGKFENDQSASWSEGDWNADGIFNTGDFVTAFGDGGYEQGVRTALIVVPEPTGLALLKIACLTSAVLIRKQRG
ncbi:MAG: hypothetical protein KDB23_05160 [Planctomycetales bacterium]|nr:hypothetical protein [Planctomycetales bacterium]